MKPYRKLISKDPDLQYASYLISRLKKLIVEPLDAVMCEETFPHCIIVVDALDECKEEECDINDSLSSSPYSLTAFLH